MNDTISLSRDDLERKRDQISSQIKQLEKDREHIEYILREFFNSPQHSLFNESVNPKLIQLDPSLATKPLVLAILRREDREMTWDEVYKIFHEVKPEISETTVRVSLSQLNRDPSKPVKLIQKGDSYTYIYEKSR